MLFDLNFGSFISYNPMEDPLKLLWNFWRDKCYTLIVSKFIRSFTYYIFWLYFSASLALEIIDVCRLIPADKLQPLYPFKFPY